jgi:hypothetical protein
MSTTLHTTFAAEMNLADGALVRVMENGEEFLNLRRRTRIPVASIEDEKPQKT